MRHITVPSTTEPVRIDKKVVSRIRKYVKDTPMTISGFISAELSAVMDRLSPSKSIKK